MSQLKRGAGKTDKKQTLRKECEPPLSPINKKVNRPPDQKEKSYSIRPRVLSETCEDKLISKEDYHFIRNLIYQHSRINLGADKQALVTSRLAKRLRLLRIDRFSEYIALLRGPLLDDELSHLVDAISTNHTHFFRETQHFDFLKAHVLPKCGRTLAVREPLRIWSAASSSGEEPYTLAILLSENLPTTPEGSWEITASDISSRILEKARQGIYPTDRLAQVPMEWQRKYFQRGTGDWEGYLRIRDELRNRVAFYRLNLLEPKYPFEKKFHVIFCRNVMIYFDRATQQDLVPKLAEALVPGGYLMVGHSESLGGIHHGLKTIQPAVYQKPD